MPIYDFRCRQCGETREILVQREAASMCCPSCGSDEMERLLSSFNVSSRGMSSGGTTCCGREERCDSPPCSSGGGCCR
jgi:putative FmdB family regulatory protein